MAYILRRVAGIITLPLAAGNLSPCSARLLHKAQCPSLSLTYVAAACAAGRRVPTNMSFYMRESNPPQDTHEHLRHPAGHMLHRSFNHLYTALCPRPKLCAWRLAVHPTYYPASFGAFSVRRSGLFHVLTS